MARMQSQFVFVAFVLLCSLQLGSCLKCFQCIQMHNGICRSKTGVENASIDCDGTCVAHILAPTTVNAEIGGHKVAVEIQETTVRVCAIKNYCEAGKAAAEREMGLKTQSCTECDSNYCNSGSIAIPSFTVAAIIGVIYYFF